jgi:lysozyme
MQTPKRKKQPSRTNTSLRILLLLVFIGGITVVSFKIYRTIRRSSKLVDRNSLIAEIPEGFSSFGIDISHHQGDIDWEKLFHKEHFDTIIHFVYCKATEGADHIDTRWNYNREMLQQLEVPNGAYHFFSSKTLPRPQAAHFLSQWKKTASDLPPVLDVEAEGFSDEDLRAKMKIWLEVIEKETNMRPIIYTSLHFFETKFAQDFKKYNFWIAAYSRQPDCIDDKRIIHWQYSETGELPCIDEKVDLNVSKLSIR